MVCQQKCDVAICGTTVEPQHQSRLLRTLESPLTWIKPTKLDISIGSEQNVGCFDVAVDLSLGMQVLETQQDLAADNRNLLLCKHTRFELQASQ